MAHTTSVKEQAPVAAAPVVPELSRKDFVSDQDVRWCPGCGDYSILSSVQKILPTLGIPREKFAFISGIGCSSRFPYYMNTYGFHTIHGRAPTVATGLKTTRPDLSVWMVTGDGDALSIGGNHFMHVLRRNVDIKILLFNNRIYGLTKGQYSPTSEVGKRTKSTPYGSLDHPINPICLALASEATFVARTIDVDGKHMAATLERAARHKGTAFVEIYQNCLIFNDGAFNNFSERAVRPEQTVVLEHGKPLTFGKSGEYGIRLNGAVPERVEIGKNGVTVDDLVVHDENADSPINAYTLAHMEYPDFPVPLGVFRAIEKPTYDGMVEDQVQSVTKQRGKGDLQALLSGPEPWTVE